MRLFECCHDQNVWINDTFKLKYLNNLELSFVSMETQCISFLISKVYPLGKDVFMTMIQEKSYDAQERVFLEKRILNILKVMKLVNIWMDE